MCRCDTAGYRQFVGFCGTYQVQAILGGNPPIGTRPIPVKFEAGGAQLHTPAIQPQGVLGHSGFIHTGHRVRPLIVDAPEAIVPALLAASACAAQP